MILLRLQELKQKQKLKKSRFIKNSFFIKNSKLDDIPIILDKELAFKYEKYLSKLLKKIEKVDEEILKITKND